MKRLLFWLILVLFIALASWWVLYFPYDPRKLYRAIPSNAIFVSEHKQLAERWRSIAGNPVVLGVLNSFGVEQKKVADVVSDPVIGNLVDRFGSRDTVVAYVPSLGNSGAPAWVLGSWAGGNAQYLRSRFLTGMLQDLKPARTDRGRRIWIYDTGKSPSDPKLSIALADGLLLGCLSSEPDGVSYLVDRIEGGGPLLGELAETIGKTGQEDNCLDSGWLIGRSGSAGFIPSKVRWALTSCWENYLAGWVKGKLAMPEAGPLAETVDLKELKHILGNAPATFAILPYAYVESLVSNPNSPAYLKVIARAIRQGIPDKGCFFACLLSSEYSGRILGLRVPAVVAGVKMRDGEKPLDLVIETLDKLNAKYGWALIPGHEGDDQQVVVIQSTRSDVYGSLKAEERVAFTARDGWLIFSSNMASLKKLMAGAAQDAERNTAEANAGWARGIGDRPAVAYASMNMEATGKALKDALAVYSLVLMVQNSGEDAASQRKTLDAAKGMINSVAALREGKFWLSRTADETKLEFRLGGRNMNAVSLQNKQPANK